MVFPDVVYGNVNFGWALTPQPKYIPLDGSTIYVFIDGVNKGNVNEYGNYSSDIATAFPGYANTNNAVGHYFIDLVSYANGIHTIGWEVYDSDGVGEGIGSRFFTIQNTSAVFGEIGASLTSAEKNMGRRYGLVYELAELTVNRTDPIGINRGYKQRVDPEWIFPDEKGKIQIEMEEVSRIELYLNRKKIPSGIEHERLSSFEGYLVVGEKLRPLPIGSTLDTKKGIFYWMPGPGFIGEYEYVFIRNIDGMIELVLLNVIIVPKF